MYHDAKLVRSLADENKVLFQETSNWLDGRSGMVDELEQVNGKDVELKGSQKEIMQQMKLLSCAKEVHYGYYGAFRKIGDSSSSALSRCGDGS